MMKKKKAGRVLLSFLLSLAMVIGFMPGMSMTVYAEAELPTVTISPDGSGTVSISTVGTGLFAQATATPAGGYRFVEWTYSNSGSTESVTNNPWSNIPLQAFDNGTYTNLTAVFEPTTTPVSGISLDQSAVSLSVGGTETLTATVAPNNATDKTLKWSVGGTNADAVKLYTDEACTTEVGTDATGTLTVYAKGISAGSATVTCTSNANSNKSASCDVTVNTPVLAPVSYMAWNGTTLVEKTGDDACTDYTVVTADTTTFEGGKWYVVSNSVTVSSRITVTGTANLILCDGATLTASKGITVNSSNTLNIYAQSAGTGELSAGNTTYAASIGGGGGAVQAAAP